MTQHQVFQFSEVPPFDSETHNYGAEASEPLTGLQNLQMKLWLQY